MIEFVIGKESHTSNWGKYYVKGLKNWQAKEDSESNHNDKHHSYQYYLCLDVPDGTVFSIFEQSGDKRGTDQFCFSLCVIDQNAETKDYAKYGNGYCKGNYRRIIKTNTKIKSSRLLEWWSNSSDKSLKSAEHCATYIQKRGVQNLPPIN